MIPLKKGKSRVTNNGTLQFYCPACKELHTVNPKGWNFNGDYDKPTFSPSILVTWGDDRRCHSFIKDGEIQYLSDSTHELAGQTVDLEDVKD